VLKYSQVPAIDVDTIVCQHRMSFWSALLLRLFRGFQAQDR
jgi:hypothetical protein